MNIKENMKKYAPDFLRVVLISIITGVVCGLVGAIFVKSIAFSYFMCYNGRDFKIADRPHKLKED